MAGASGKKPFAKIHFTGLLGKNLLAMDVGNTSDPYVKYTVAPIAFLESDLFIGHSAKYTAKDKWMGTTDVKYKTCAPVWRPWNFDIELATAADARDHYQYLIVEVYDKDLITDDFLGQAFVPVSLFLQHREQKSVTVDLRSRIKPGVDELKAAGVQHNSNLLARGTLTFEFTVTGVLDPSVAATSPGLGVTTLFGGNTAHLSLASQDIYFSPKVPALLAVSPGSGSIFVNCYHEQHHVSKLLTLTPSGHNIVSDVTLPPRVPYKQMATATVPVVSYPDDGSGTSTGSGAGASSSGLAHHSSHLSHAASQSSLLNAFTKANAGDRGFVQHLHPAHHGPTASMSHTSSLPNELIPPAPANGANPQHSPRTAALHAPLHHAMTLSRLDATGAASVDAGAHYPKHGRCKKPSVVTDLKAWDRKRDELTAAAAPAAAATPAVADRKSTASPSPRPPSIDWSPHTISILRVETLANNLSISNDPHTVIWWSGNGPSTPSAACGAVRWNGIDLKPGTTVNGVPLTAHEFDLLKAGALSFNFETYAMDETTYTDECQSWGNATLSIPAPESGFVTGSARDAEVVVLLTAIDANSSGASSSVLTATATTSTSGGAAAVHANAKPLLLLKVTLKLSIAATARVSAAVLERAVPPVVARREKRPTTTTDIKNWESKRTALMAAVHENHPTGVRSVTVVKVEQLTPIANQHAPTTFIWLGGADAANGGGAIKFTGVDFTSPNPPGDCTIPLSSADRERLNAGQLGLHVEVQDTDMEKWTDAIAAWTNGILKVPGLGAEHPHEQTLLLAAWADGTTLAPASGPRTVLRVTIRYNTVDSPISAAALIRVPSSSSSTASASSPSPTPNAGARAASPSAVSPPPMIVSRPIGSHHQPSKSMFAPIPAIAAAAAAASAAAAAAAASTSTSVETVTDDGKLPYGGAGRRRSEALEEVLLCVPMFTAKDSGWIDCIDPCTGKIATKYIVCANFAPMAVVQEPNTGHLCVLPVNGNFVAIYTSAGKHLHNLVAFNPSNTLHPIEGRALTLGPDGVLYALYFQSQVIYVVTPFLKPAAPVRKLGLSVPDARGMTVDRAGNFYLTTRAGPYHLVRRLNHTTGTGASSGSGEESVVVGIPGVSACIDGSGLAASFGFIQGTVSGSSGSFEYVLVIDRSGHALRKIVLEVAPKAMNVVIPPPTALLEALAGLTGAGSDAKSAAK